MSILLQHILSAHVVFQPPLAAAVWSTRCHDFIAARHNLPGARELRREQHAGAVFHSPFTFCNFAGTPGGARAASGRRPSPHAQPSHPFSLLSPPSFPLLPPLPRAWVWMGVVGEGGKGGVILTLLDVSSTSCSLDARLTLAPMLAQRSLDSYASTQRARLRRLRPQERGRPSLRSVWIP